ncbi:MAG: HPr-like protein Crh [Elusimicrobia bacterium ADurb.Bin231]|nr:MAG: HPr-like protein Crh [Elusimicrobia bacterium ADurb.Bin231]
MEKKITIQNKLGLHARPAALFVQTASRYKSAVKVLLGEQVADGKSIMGLMMLAAGPGVEICISATGPDEKEVIDSLESLIINKFAEE